MSTINDAINKNFDYAYLLEIMLWKMRKMQHFFESEKVVCIDALEISKDIKCVCDALQRYLNDDYCNLQYAILEAYCGKIKIKTKPYKNDMIEFDGFYFDNCDNQERALRIWRKLNKRSQDLKQRDFEYVFDTLKNKLQEWWD